MLWGVGSAGEKSIGKTGDSYNFFFNNKEFKLKKVLIEQLAMIRYYFCCI